MEKRKYFQKQSKKSVQKSQSGSTCTLPACPPAICSRSSLAKQAGLTSDNELFTPCPRIIETCCCCCGVIVATASAPSGGPISDPDSVSHLLIKPAQTCSSYFCCRNHHGAGMRPCCFHSPTLLSPHVTFLPPSLYSWRLFISFILFSRCVGSRSSFPSGLMIRFILQVLGKVVVMACHSRVLKYAC
jgi:hypothetical protein